MFYGWIILGSCITIGFYLNGVVTLGFTTFFEPIANEFSWSYAQISFASSLRGLEMNMLGPVTGFAADKWGPRRLMLIGTGLICLGFVMLSRIHSLQMFYISFFIIATGMSTCSGTVLMTSVNNWFRGKATLVVGILSAGLSMGGLLVPVLTKVIDRLQWREAMLIVAIGMLVVGIPVALLMKHKPEQYGVLPDGATNPVVNGVKNNVTEVIPEVSITAKQALRTKVFWLIAITSTISSFVINGTLTHVMPYMSSVGVTRNIASMATLGIAMASVAGRLGGIWISGRIGRRNLYIIAYVLLVLAMLAFQYIAAGWMWLIIPFLALFGIAWGCCGIMKATLQRQYFGRGSYGTIYGLMDLIQVAGNLAGAPIAGWVYDRYGSYSWTWLGYAGVAAIAVFLALTLPEPREFTITPITAQAVKI